MDVEGDLEAELGDIIMESYAAGQVPEPAEDASGGSSQNPSPGAKASSGRASSSGKGRGRGRGRGRGKGRAKGRADPESDADSGDDLVEAWSAVENRCEIPSVFPDGIVWERRYEPVNPDFIKHFFRDIAARGLDMEDGSDSDCEVEDGNMRDERHRGQRGPIFVQLNWVLRRLQQIPGHGWCLKVVRSEG